LESMSYGRIRRSDEEQARKILFVSPHNYQDQPSMYISKGQGVISLHSPQR
jgi:hypothetical protein